MVGWFDLAHLLASYTLVNVWYNYVLWVAPCMLLIVENNNPCKHVWHVCKYLNRSVYTIQRCWSCYHSLIDNKVVSNYIFDKKKKKEGFVKQIPKKCVNIIKKNNSMSGLEHFFRGKWVALSTQAMSLA